MIGETEMPNCPSATLSTTGVAYNASKRNLCLNCEKPESNKLWRPAWPDHRLISVYLLLTVYEALQLIKNHIVIYCG